MATEGKYFGVVAYNTIAAALCKNRNQNSNCLITNQNSDLSTAAARIVRIAKKPIVVIICNAMHDSKDERENILNS